MTLDEFLPSHVASEVHSIHVAASPEEALAAARGLTVREVPLLVVLMALRRLPAAATRLSTLAIRRRALDEPILDGFLRAGFAVLADRPDELVVGGVGRFWTPDGGIRRVARHEFVTFEEPGFAKAVMNFHVRTVPGGTELTTETRVACTDEAARRTFRRYWRIVMPGSAAIRRAWLRAIRKRAEDG